MVYQYTCGGCDGLFYSTQSFEEAYAAGVKLFGPMTKAEMTLLCSVCEAQFLEWLAKNPAEGVGRA